VAISLVGAPASAWAQAGWFLIPSFQLTESFDDNIFGTSTNRQSDFISRFTPGLQGGYQSEPFTLLVSSAFDAEVFAKNPDQNDATSGKHAGMTLRYVPDRPWTLSLEVAYTETRSLSVLTQALTPTPAVTPTGTGTAQPGTTPPATTPPGTTPGTTPATTTQATPTPANTLQSGRQRNTILGVSPTAAYQVTPLTMGTSTYSYTQASQEGGTSNSAHQVRLGVSHQFTLIDTGNLDYILSIFSDSESSSSTSNAVTLGWTRQLTPQTMASVSGGPRFSGGGVSPEINASLSHEFKAFENRVQASLTYTRSQGFVIGQSGTVNTEVLSGGIMFEPIRSLQVNVRGGVARLTGGTGPDTTTYGTNVGVSYLIYKWLSARAAYSYSLQDQTSGNISHNVISFGFDATYPIRIDQ
jgi:hypothetical protein